VHFVQEVVRLRQSQVELLIKDLVLTDCEMMGQVVGKIYIHTVGGILVDLEMEVVHKDGVMMVDFVENHWGGMVVVIEELMVNVWDVLQVVQL
jgi:hypothetical protein